MAEILVSLSSDRDDTEIDEYHDDCNIRVSIKKKKLKKK